MPIVSINERHLFQKLGRKYTEEEMTNLCFDFGLELDEITSEKDMVSKEQGSSKATNCSSEPIYKIEVPANRYDLLCAEGLCRSLQVFHGKSDLPKFTKIEPTNKIQIKVAPETAKVRPFVVAAVLRDIKLDKDRYDSFIDLQDKIHFNIGRKRALVSVGTHDLDTLTPPFFYNAEKPDDIKFIPLNKTNTYSAAELMQLYSTDSHLKSYLPIIHGKELFPVIRDSKHVVASFPPIINSEHSKISLNTRNIFIEITANDLNKAVIALDVIVTMFSEYCDKRFTVEPCEVIQADGTKVIYPKLAFREEIISIDYVNTLIGTTFNADQMIKLLKKMGLKTELSCETENLLSVTVPPTRHDILHACDVAEDVAIAYGYDNIEESLPNTFCISATTEVNRLTNLLRPELAQSGFTEVLTFALCSRDDISTKLRKQLNQQLAVHIENPKTQEFQVVRTSLLPGILHTVCNNKSMPLPIKLFEIQDVVLKDSSIDVGCRNERRLCALYYGKTSSGFEVIHGLLDRVMQMLEVSDKEVKSGDNFSSRSNFSYHIEASQDMIFFQGRCAKVVLMPGSIVIGHFGTLHPEVVRNFELSMPCSALEINLEHFL